LKIGVKLIKKEGKQAGRTGGEVENVLKIRYVLECLFFIRKPKLNGTTIVLLSVIEGATERGE